MFSVYLDPAASWSKPRLFERNLRYDNPWNGLMRAGKLLRLRQDDGARLTYKAAPPEPVESEVRVRQELEISLSDFDTAARILGHIGLEIRQQYEKYRETFTFGELELVLDDVELLVLELVLELVELGEAQPVGIVHYEGHAMLHYPLVEYVALLAFYLHGTVRRRKHEFLPVYIRQEEKDALRGDIIPIAPDALRIQFRGSPKCMPRIHPEGCGYFAWRSWGGGVLYGSNCQVTATDTTIADNQTITDVNSFKYNGGDANDAGEEIWGIAQAWEDEEDVADSDIIPGIDRLEDSAPRTEEKTMTSYPNLRE